MGKEEVTRRRMEIRDVVVTTGEREFTELSIEVWVSAGVLVVSGIEWVSVARESNTRVEQVVKLIAELVLKVTENDTNVIYRKFIVSEISELLR